MGTINLGPFAFAVAPLLWLGAALVALTVARRSGRKHQVDAEARVWVVLIAAGLAARIAFVSVYFDMYRSQPWSMLDVRDGGFMLSAGILTALTLAAWFAWRERAARKPLLHSASAGVLAWLLGTALATAFSPAPAELPRMVLTRLDGGSAPLEATAGKPMVINLWASWCPPCRHEMPVLRDAQISYPDITFVFVNQGEPAETVRTYLDSAHLLLDNVLLDPDRLFGERVGSRALPTTLFVDHRGMLVGRRVGELSAATLAQRVAPLRAQRAPGQHRGE
ncbi:MAG TPA: TlpA disulfide reductase family protein [Burkholderiaceae bacterium]|nr:TlpA disulfide reductase family protein [Burkholderiaceae bacterium]